MAHWILVADSARARLFAADQGFDHLRELAAFVHPESRMKAEELLSDERGSTWSGPRGSHSAAEPHTDFHRAEQQAFAHQIGEHLNHARAAGDLTALDLVAPPTFLGLLRDELDGPTSKIVGRSADRDLSQLPVRELGERLQHLLAG